MDCRVSNPDPDSKRSAVRVSRRKLLGLCLASSVVPWNRQSHADTFVIFRVRAPQLDSRVMHWQNVAGSFLKQLATSKHPNILRFRRKLAEVPCSIPPVKLIKTVNEVVNAAAPYVPDIRSSFVRDHWATPVEFLERGGDCEDFALTKATTLIYLGWAFDKMYLAIGLLDQPNAKPLGHGVLVTALSDSVDSHLVLRNRSEEIVGLRNYSQFRPLYGIDSQGVIMFVRARPYRTSATP